MSVFGKRLKAARTEVGLSQEGLGIEAGLDPMSASARMNRYEVGARSPNYDLVVALAKVLKLPAAYFYAAREDEAELLRLYHRLPAEARRKMLDALRAQSDNG
ncbi:helix-turn-helix domain-containing protein [Hydrogenophaga sp. BPS33]|uniref:helix-turn-helix domain-containing protein n=1 Tax=Hydrogenophaga sp. BPS33 TaxID=2651974 RepID=UPI00131F8369|nr:helix-turn-helix transcriptional regulator [Hydrogenophaga sp. BPS33]QHE84729.1 helix-turn-helix transcriptional regulator [Hydrogenophaga sp. BPS33]